MDKIRSLEALRRAVRTEARARAFLERVVWPDGRFCPHCGTLKSWPIRGRTARPGLYECADCHGQFTVTTRTPLHGTKLPLRAWLEAIYLVLTSSKGISSVVLARLLGVTQPTAWKLAHAIRERMDARHEAGPALKGIVEVDEKYVGGAPKYQKHVHHPRGRGTRKTPVLIAASREGKARAQVVPGLAARDLSPVVVRHVDPNAILMSDSDRSHDAIGQAFKGHRKVNHAKKQFVAPGGVHVNTAESFGAQLERAQVGVFHWISPRHLQRYVDEIAFRWNQRVPKLLVYRNGPVRTYFEPGPFHDMVGALFVDAVGRQVRRAKDGGLRWPP